MTKSPLSKEPITALSCADYLKTTQNKMVNTASYLNEAISLIKENLHGDEFDSACVYINDKILCNLSDIVDDINDILKSLTNAVNEYNDDIYDADGNKYYVEKVNYESGIKLEYTSLGAKKTVDKSENDDLIYEDSNTNTNSSNYTSYVPSGSVNSDVADAGSVSSILSITLDLIHLIINHSIKNIGTSIYDENSVIKYENNDYKWDLIISLFLEKHELDDYVKKVTFKDTTATVFLNNDTSFNILDVETYEDLLKGIELYKGQSLVGKIEEGE